MIGKSGDGHYSIMQKCSCGREWCDNWLLVANQCEQSENKYMLIILPDIDGNGQTVWFDRHGIENLIEDLSNLLAIDE